MLSNHGEDTLDRAFAEKLIETFASIVASGVELAVVVGGGNIFRGDTGKLSGFSKLAGDHAGMVATVINTILLADIAETKGIPVKTFSAFGVADFIKEFSASDAKQALSDKKIVLLAGGTGKPYFTTDSGAALRSHELECDVLLKPKSMASTTKTL